jgi:hypothetical protein
MTRLHATTAHVIPERPPIQVMPGRRRAHDYIRHSTTIFLAVLEAAAAYPGEELHVVCDNYATLSATGAFTDRWNDHPHPFTCTKDADEILASIQRAKTKTDSLTRH